MDTLINKIMDFQNTQDMDYKRIMGGLYGHAYGDASGGTLEFKGISSKSNVQKAMTLIGKGVFQLSPGQITDDGELTLQVFRALFTYYCDDTNTNSLDDLLYNNYKQWFQSEPFDIGHTTRNAFEDNDTKEMIWTNVKVFNTNSESNGALMRCMPFGIFAYIFKLDEKQLYNLIEIDVSFTHSKKCVVNIVYTYSMIVYYLLKNTSTEDIYEKITSIAIELDDMKLLDLIYNYNESRDVTRQMGWDAHAFSLTLYCLFNNFDFEKSIEYVLSLGGDTDTNAAIVGGVIGTKWGSDSIPLYYLLKIIQCNPNHDRSNFHPKEYLTKLSILLPYRSV